MKYWTLAEIKTRIQTDLAIEQEEFVSVSELVAYINEGIDEAEAEIHSIYEDYFLAYETIDLVSGTSQYSLPTDIYANKIRGIIYKNGKTIYALERIRFNDMFEDIEKTNEDDTNARYRYFLLNDSAAIGIQMEMVPPARETLSGGLKVYYLRNANRLSADTDYCDIPEFVSFVMQFAKVRIYEKEGHPSIQIAASMLNQQRQQMISTLTAMVPDGDNEIEKDFTFYTETV